MDISAQPEMAELHAKNAAAAKLAAGEDEEGDVSVKKTNESETFEEKFGDRSVNADNKADGMLGGIRGGVGALKFGQGLSGGNGMGDSALNAITAGDKTRTMGIGAFLPGLSDKSASSLLADSKESAVDVAKDDDDNSGSNDVEVELDADGNREGYYGRYRW